MASEGSAIMANIGAGGEEDKNIEQWKIKKLIKSLEAARGYVLAMSLSFSFKLSFNVYSLRYPLEMEHL
jgi:hypothetical protein